jgi:hypothetical protein
MIDVSRATEDDGGLLAKVSKWASMSARSPLPRRPGSILSKRRKKMAEETVTTKVQMIW